MHLSNNVTSQLIISNHQYYALHKKTASQCNYLYSEELRREINEGLNVVETGIRPIALFFTAKVEK